MSRISRVGLVLAISLGWLACDAPERSLGDVALASPPDSARAVVRAPELPEDYASPDTVRVTGRLARDIELGFATTALAVVGDRVLFSDQWHQPHLGLLDLRTGETLATFGRHGGGPREFRVPFSFRVASHDPPRVWVYDFKNQRLSLLDLSDSAAQPRVLRQVPLRVGAQLLDPARLGDRIVSNGLFVDHTLLLADSAGRPLRRVRGAPPFDEREVPSPVGLLQVNASSLAVHPDGDRLALAYQHENRIDLYTPEGRRYRTLVGPREIENRFRVDPETSRLRWSRRDERAYIGIQATKRHLYAQLCLVCSFEEAPRRLHVFDWEGAFRGELVVPEGVIDFDVTPDDSLLVGSYLEDGMFLRIATWELPAWLRETRTGDGLPGRSSSVYVTEAKRKVTEISEMRKGGGRSAR